ncbi:MAG: quinol:cytochrome C oxidoreductase [Bernardetiaceae bacterium]
MAGHHKVNISELNEQYEFKPKAKKNALTLLVVGLVMTILGIVMAISSEGDHHGDHHDGQHSSVLMGDDMAGIEGTQKLTDEGGEHHHTPVWVKRIMAAVWHNNVFFLGISVIGLFFVALQYAAKAGWSAGLRRIPEAMASFLPVISGFFIITFFWVNHDVFHWTHDYLYDPTHPEYDEIIAGKEGFLNMPFYLARMVIFLGGWSLFMFFLRKHSLAEDKEGGQKRYHKMLVLSTVFIIFFAASSSVASWDWVMSIDTHWFSTLFGWYHFASWFVTGLSVITLTMIFLKEEGYLKIVKEDHFHDMGKFVFAFSIFWTYLWFSQYLLIYYANIPEETIYYIERLSSGHYGKLVFINIGICFLFPFFGLMTRNAKRKTSILKIVCMGVIVGHWLDFYLMTAPGILKEDGTIGLLEIGLPLVYGGIFAYWVGNKLSQAPLVTTKHPMIEECVYHNC